MVHFSSVFSVVDSHTAGEPTRIVLSGFPPIRGGTMAEKWLYVRENFDHLRCALMLEPRGHRDMFGSILVPPERDDADWGIIFMDGGGYLTMCGHGTIGAATVVVNLGLIQVKEPETVVRFDTPAGPVTAHVVVEQGQARQVWFRSVPAFLFAEAVRVDVPGFGSVRVDVAFGGNFFAMVSAQELGLQLEPAESQRLVEVGLQIRAEVNAQVKVQHPLQPHIDHVELTEITGPPTHPDATFKNVVVFGDGQIDRSPCGTGTCARMAALHAKNKLRVGEPFVHEGIAGSLFYGEILSETQVGELTAIVPRIAGSAYITGLNMWTIHPEDPMRYGFSI
jgi:proline racemase